LLDGVGLQLYIFYLREPNDSNVRKKGLLRAFSLAKLVLSKLDELNTASNLVGYAPAIYYQLALLAGMTILKMSHSSYSKYIDAEGGKRAFNIAVSLLRQTSLEDSDLPGRSSKILTQLWSMQDQQGRRDEEPNLKLRTRSGASLLHDSLWTWRERFGGQGSGQETPNFGMYSQDMYGQVNSDSPTDTTGSSLGNNAVSGMEEPVFDGLNVEDLFNIGIFSLLPYDFDGDTSLLTNT